MPRIAPDIFRKRYLMEGFFRRDPVDGDTLREYFRVITTQLDLTAYAEPIIHHTGGKGKPENQGYDAFVPLISSGIYVCVWSGPRFVSVVLYACDPFDEQRALAVTREFFGIDEADAVVF